MCRKCDIQSVESEGVIGRPRAKGSTLCDAASLDWPFSPGCASSAAASADDNQLTPQEKAKGWMLLFDGKTLEGWMRSDGKPSNHGVEQSSINPHRCGAYMMVYDKQFSNFELHCDYKVTVLCNSGIFVRTFPLTPDGSVGYNGIEIAIQDGIKEGYHATGAIYDLSPVLVDATKPTGQWNHIDITCDKNLITVVLNGQKVNSIDLDRFTQAAQTARRHGRTSSAKLSKTHPRHGYIGLQDHGSPCCNKNIKLRVLPCMRGVDGRKKRGTQLRLACPKNGGRRSENTAL